MGKVGEANEVSEERRGVALLLVEEIKAIRHTTKGVRKV